MPFAITLRRGGDKSPFRHQLIRLITAPGGTINFLCSGYFWEPDASGRPRACYSILDDQLLDAIRCGCQSGHIVTIAGKFSGYWRQHYSNFVRKLRSAGVMVEPYEAKRGNWHAKIAVRIGRDSKPLAAIVGSSNLTGPAYRVPYGRWNYECDVTIWQNVNELNAHFMGDIEHTPRMDRILGILHPEIKQPLEVDQLNRILQDAHGKEGLLIPFEE